MDRASTITVWLLFGTSRENVNEQFCGCPTTDTHSSIPRVLIRTSYLEYCVIWTLHHVTWSVVDLAHAQSLAICVEVQASVIKAERQFEMTAAVQDERGLRITVVLRSWGNKKVYSGLYSEYAFLLYTPVQWANQENRSRKPGFGQFFLEGCDQLDSWTGASGWCVRCFAVDVMIRAIILFEFCGWNIYQPVRYTNSHTFSFISLKLFCFLCCNECTVLLKVVISSLALTLIMCLYLSSTIPNVETMCHSALSTFLLSCLFLRNGF